jgi:hypothetical protein
MDCRRCPACRMAKRSRDCFVRTYLPSKPPLRPSSRTRKLSGADDTRSRTAALCVRTRAYARDACSSVELQRLWNRARQTMQVREFLQPGSRKHSYYRVLSVSVHIERSNARTSVTRSTPMDARAERSTLSCIRARHEAPFRCIAFRRNVARSSSGRHAAAKGLLDSRPRDVRRKTGESCRNH